MRMKKKTVRYGLMFTVLKLLGIPSPADALPSHSTCPTGLPLVMGATQNDNDVALTAFDYVKEYFVIGGHTKSPYYNGCLGQTCQDD